METDVLGWPYERHSIDLGTDDEGPVVATLVRRRADTPTRRAVLYVHGFVDYFFQTHLADFFVERGWDFYALDLRKYGRSLLPHQTPNFARSLTDYFPELDEAARIIRAQDGHDQLLVAGHSTGGLITSLWAHTRQGRGIVDGLFRKRPSTMPRSWRECDHSDVIRPPVEWPATSSWSWPSSSRMIRAASSSSG